MTELVLWILSVGVTAFNFFFVLGFVIGFIWLICFLAGSVLDSHARSKSNREVE